MTDLMGNDEIAIHSRCWKSRSKTRGSGWPKKVEPRG